MSTRLVLVRHGQTDWNAGGRFQGQADIELNGVGVEQARRMAPHVAGLGPAHVVTSDLKRASLTAQYIADAAGLPSVASDPRLQEINVGDWAGLHVSDARERFPWMEDALRAGRDFRRSDSGETATEAGARAASCLRDVASAFPGEVTVAVGHGLALRMAILQLLGWTMQQGAALSGLWNCSWSVLELRQDWRLLSYNNVPPGFDAVLPSLSAR